LREEAIKGAATKAVRRKAQAAGIKAVMIRVAAATLAAAIGVAAATLAGATGEEEIRVEVTRLVAAIMMLLTMAVRVKRMAATVAKETPIAGPSKPD
jgi:hypothetical protein